jgi:hypothetical protein
MAAPESTKFQINYKLSDGTLINLYATDIKELETGLADLAMNAANIKATAVDLGGGAVASTSAAVSAISNAFNATPVAASPTDAPVCKHGPMTYKTGTSTKGPWRAWMCPSPKGAVDKCETSWIR